MVARWRYIKCSVSSSRFNSAAALLVSSPSCSSADTCCFWLSMQSRASTMSRSAIARCLYQISRTIDRPPARCSLNAAPSPTGSAKPGSRSCKMYEEKHIIDCIYCSNCFNTALPRGPLLPFNAHALKQPAFLSLRRDRAQNFGIVVGGFVHPRCDRPHGQGRRRESGQQLAWVRIKGREPVIVGFWGDYHGHAIVDLGHQLIGWTGDDGEAFDPLRRAGTLPGVPNCRQGKGLTTAQRNGIGLLCRDAANGLPFEEIVDRQETAAAPVSLPKGRQRGNGLCFGIDRLAGAALVLAHVW